MRLAEIATMKIAPLPHGHARPRPPAVPRAALRPGTAFGMLPVGWGLVLAALLHVSAAGAVVYEVHPDGTGDFPTVQEAVLGVAEGDVIELTPGVYTGPGNRDIHFMGRAVTVRSQSGDAADAVIDCQGSVQDPHRGFYLEDGEGPGSVLEAITIRNGYASGET
jgi:hypothetical protein